MKKNMINHNFRLVILLENEIRLLSRILILFNRINLKIDYVNITKKQKNVNQCLLELKCNEIQLLKINKLIKKIIGVIHTRFFKKKLKIKLK